MAVDLQHWNQSKRIDRTIGSRILLVGPKVDLARFIVDALQLERDPHSVAGRRAPVIVENRSGHVSACLQGCDEGRYHLRWHSDRAGRRLVDNRPPASRADPHLSVFADEFHAAIEARAFWSFPGPGAGSQPLAFKRGAQVIDLVPYHDPEIILLMGGVGNAPP